MNEARLQRYKQKMNIIVNKLESIPKEIKTEVAVNATLYCVQVSIDATMDIIAMLAKDIGHDVSDDYHNIGNMVKSKIISASAAEDLKRFNGLRNAIVHKYNNFEEESVIKNLTAIRTSLEGFLEIVEAKINEIAKKN